MPLKIETFKNQGWRPGGMIHYTGAFLHLEAGDIDPGLDLQGAV